MARPAIDFLSYFVMAYSGESRVLMAEINTTMTLVLEKRSVDRKALATYFTRVTAQRQQNQLSSFLT